jgi:hypothetical protein
MNDPTPDLVFGAVLTRQQLEVALPDAAMATRTRKTMACPRPLRTVNTSNCQYLWIKFF